MTRLGPFWNIESNEWIRFTYVMGQVIVEHAKPMKGNPELIGFWQIFKDDEIPEEGWHLFNPEEGRTDHYRINPLQQRVLRRHELDDDRGKYHQTYEKWKESAG